FGGGVDGLRECVLFDAFADEREKELDVEPRDDVVGANVSQLVEVRQALPALEEKLDLPTQTIELQELTVGEPVGRDGREEEPVLGVLELLRVDVGARALGDRGPSLVAF